MYIAEYSWIDNSYSDSQAITGILRKPNVHYRFHKSSPTAPILSQSKPVHASPFHFLKIYLNVILPSMARSTKWSLSTRSPYQNPVCTSTALDSYHMSRPSHYFYFHHPNNIWWVEQILSFSLCSLLRSTVPPFLLGPYIFLSTLFSDTLNLCSFLDGEAKFHTRTKNRQYCRFRFT